MRDVKRSSRAAAVVPWTAFGGLAVIFATSCTAEPPAVLTAPDGTDPIPARCDEDDPNQECLEEGDTTLNLADEAALGLRIMEVSADTMLLELEPGRELPERLRENGVVYRGRMRDRPSFLRRIERVERDGQRVRLRTRPARIMEAFRRGRIRRTYRVDRDAMLSAMDTGSSMEPLVALDSDVAARREALRLLDLDCSGPLVNTSVEGVDVNIDLQQCEASLDVDVDVTLRWGFLLPNEFSIVASGDFAAALEFTADVSAELVVAPPRTRLVGTSIPVQLGPINATLDFDIYAGYEVNASANLHLHSGFELTAGVDAGFRWEKGENVGPIWDTESSWTPIGPDITLTGSLEAEVYLEPQLSFLVFGAAGPSVTLHTYLGASADATVTNETESSSGIFDVEKEVCVELFAGVEPELGARVEVFGTELFDESFTLASFEASLVDACYSTNETVNTNACDVNPECTVDEDCGGGVSESACRVYNCTDRCQCQELTQLNCCSGPADCDDGDVCTADLCMDRTGSCTHTPVPGCCVADADCDDGLELTVDACDLAANTCTHELPRTTECVGPGCCETDGDCDDGSFLTTDTCGSTGFCENTTVRAR